MADSLEEEDLDLPQPKRRRSDVGVPDWAKLAASVAGTAITTTAIVILWVNSTFATKAELAQHATQQQVDIARVSETQKGYAEAEKITGNSLSDIKARLAGIEVKLELVLDSTDPGRNRNVRNKNGY